MGRRTGQCNGGSASDAGHGSVGEPRISHYLRAPMPQPTLKTERITLVPLANEHFKREVEIDSDPEVMRYSAVKRAHARS